MKLPYQISNNNDVEWYTMAVFVVMVSNMLCAHSSKLQYSRWFKWDILNFYVKKNYQNNLIIWFTDFKLSRKVCFSHKCSLVSSKIEFHWWRWAYFKKFNLQDGGGHTKFGPLENSTRISWGTWELLFFANVPWIQMNYENLATTVTVSCAWQIHSNNQPITLSVKPFPKVLFLSIYA